MASLSTGFRLYISNTLTKIPSWANCSFAFIASATVTPVAIIVASVPSPICIAFPI